jgi:hypothetical protein
MALPFTTEDFLQVFQQYNQTIWPAQLVLYAAAVGALAWTILRPSREADLAMGLLLATMWTVMGAGYHLGFFRHINGLAVPAGVLFVLEALAFAVLALRRRLSFAVQRDAWSAVGLVFIAYGMVVYPLLGLAFGHVYPRAPVFGVAPCPTTIFTFGVLLLATRRLPAWLVVVPLLWSLLGASAAFLLGVREDLFLPVAGVLGSIGVWVRGKRTEAVAVAGR